MCSSDLVRVMVAMRVWGLASVPISSVPCTTIHSVLAYLSYLVMLYAVLVRIAHVASAPDASELRAVLERQVAEWREVLRQRHPDAARAVIRHIIGPIEVGGTNVPDHIKPYLLEPCAKRGRPRKDARRLKVPFRAPIKAEGYLETENVTNGWRPQRDSNPC